MVLTSVLSSWQSTFCFFTGVLGTACPRAPALLPFGVTFLVDV
jgi:hypothetical protein